MNHRRRLRSAWNRVDSGELHQAPRKWQAWLSDTGSLTQKIERAELQPGDLVFFNTMRRTFSHVGIYVGGGKFVHSPKPGAEVRVDDMAQTYWRKRFDGARRVQTRQ